MVSSVSTEKNSQFRSPPPFIPEETHRVKAGSRHIDTECDVTQSLTAIGLTQAETVVITETQPDGAVESRVWCSGLRMRASPSA